MSSSAVFPSPLRLLIAAVPPLPPPQYAAQVRQAFPKAEVQVVTSESAFLAALTQADWEVVVTPLPPTDARLREALLHWRAQHPRAALVALLSEGTAWPQTLPFAPDGWLPTEADWPERLLALLPAVLQRAQRRAQGHIWATMAEHAPLGLFTADTQGRLEWVNPQLAAWLGQEPHTLRGRPLTAWLQTVQPPPLAQRLPHLTAQAQPMLLRLLNGPRAEARFQGLLWRSPDEPALQGALIPTGPSEALGLIHAIQQALEREEGESPDAQLRTALSALLQATEAQWALLYLRTTTTAPPPPDLIVAAPDAPETPNPQDWPCLPYALGWPQTAMRFNHATLPTPRESSPPPPISHWMVFPLLLGKTPLGWLTLARTREHPPFDEATFEAVQGTLGLLSALLERRQQHHLQRQTTSHLQRHFTALKAFHELSERLSEAQNLSDIWHAWSTCAQQMGWRFVVLHLLPGGLQVVHHNFPPETVRQIQERLHLENLLLDDAWTQAYPIRAPLEAGRPLLQRLVWSEVLSGLPKVDQDGISWLTAVLGLPPGEDIVFLLPLYRHQQPWGLIAVWGAPHLRTDDDILLDIIRHQIQGALDKVASLEELRQRQRYAQALAALGARLTACEDELCLARRLLDHLNETLGLPRAALYRYHPAQGWLLFAQHTLGLREAAYPPVLVEAGEDAPVLQLTHAVPATETNLRTILGSQDVLVPLRTTKEVYGLLVLDIPSLTQETLEWLNQAAEMVALIWHQRRLSDRLAQQLHLHRTLRVGLLALGQHLDMEKTAQDLLEHAALLDRLQGVALWLAGPEGQTWQLFGSRGHFPRPPKPPPVPPYALAQPDPDASAEIAQYLPLMAQGRVIGALEAHWASHATPEDRETLAYLAAQGAVVLSNAQLFAQTQAGAQTLEVLFRSARQIAMASLDPEAVYEQVHRAIHEAGLEHDTFIIALYEPQTQTLQVPYIVEGGVRFPAHQISLQEASLLKTVLQQRRSLLIRDFEQEHQALGLAYQQVGESMRSILAVPLLRQDKAVGVLSVQARRSQAYQEEHRQLLETLAAQVAVALENARLYEQTRQLAITDALTGLYNRRHLFSLGAREIQRARRFGHPLTALMIDLDDFKQVNDRYGHHVGDQVLRQWAQRTAATLREVDILGRYGGEEFGVFLPETTLEQGIHLARRLRQHIAAEPFNTEKGPVRLTVSIGLAAWNEHITSAAALLQEADFAQYAAKHAGKNRIAWLDPESHDLRIER